MVTHMDERTIPRLRRSQPSPTSSNGGTGANHPRSHDGLHDWLTYRARLLSSSSPVLPTARSARRLEEAIKYVKFYHEVLQISSSPIYNVFMMSGGS
jgi:hypothetical protein